MDEYNNSFQGLSQLTEVKVHIKFNPYIQLIVQKQPSFLQKQKHQELYGSLNLGVWEKLINQPGLVHCILFPTKKQWKHSHSSWYEASKFYYYWQILLNPNIGRTLSWIQSLYIPVFQFLTSAKAQGSK